MSEADRFFNDETETPAEETARPSGLPAPEELAGLAKAHPGPDEAWAAYRRQAGGVPLWRVPPVAWIVIGATILLYGLQYVYNLLFPPDRVFHDDTLFAPTLVATAVVLVLIGIVVVIFGLRAFVRRRRFFKAFAEAAGRLSDTR